MSEAIAIHQGDITRATADAIVNAANPAMLGGGGVDGAIHQAAGPELLEHCRRVTARDGVRCPVGEARITPAGRLPARFVIHTVGPRYRIDPEPGRLLASAYRNTLGLALENGCRSVAFPAISCGAYGYPAAEAAAISVSVCREPCWADLAIEFHLFSPDLLSVWKNALFAGDEVRGG
jgi:O-acetyl-ADP-ribose deacetylase (regulator of RNase III)